ncbi:MAG: M23 family metallopeptidase [Acidimicrobiia bacterium]|nr:M23 family metallopeptidase [Acidimicrobiia bacterium]
MSRGLLVLLCALLFASLLPFRAEASDVYPIVFPVAGDHQYSDTWGAARSGGRTHQGTDIMADKMVPVVAAANGTVGWMHDEQGGKCCAMSINHDDGYASWYIHLNNDTPGTDDGQGWGFAPGIASGVRVRAGQVIGYVGDSGNAEWTVPHLHFELHDPDGVAFNPFHSLEAAVSAEELGFVCDSASVGQQTDGDDLLYYQPNNGMYWYREVDTAGCTSEVIHDGSDDAGWTSVEAVDLQGDGNPEVLFYRQDDGRFKFAALNGDGTIGEVIEEGTWSPGWTIVEPVRFEGDLADELMFYRDSDGRFAYYDVGSQGTIGTAIRTGYFGAGWSSAEPLDINGDQVDEMFFYRKGDGRFAYYYLRPDGTIGNSIRKDYFGTGWDIVEPVDVDGDGPDEILFYRGSDGRYALYDLNLGGYIGSSMGLGYAPLRLSAITSPR